MFFCNCIHKTQSNARALFKFLLNINLILKPNNDFIVNIMLVTRRGDSGQSWQGGYILTNIEEQINTFAYDLRLRYLPPHLFNQYPVIIVSLNHCLGMFGQSLRNWKTDLQSPPQLRATSTVFIICDQITSNIDSPPSGDNNIHASRNLQSVVNAMIIYRMVIVEDRCTKLQLLISYIYNHWLT